MPSTHAAAALITIAPPLPHQRATRPPHLLSFPRHPPPPPPAPRGQQVSLFVTDTGGYTPAYVYRLLAEYYSREDYSLDTELLERMKL